MFFKENIINLKTRPELIETAAAWFHSKWKVPKQAYLDSMTSSTHTSVGVPQWYVIINGKNEIIAGLGVIENDFHKRPDLTPNLCALFVEDGYRRRGIAKVLLDNACEQLLQSGINTAYLITTHTDFYEHCGWIFYGMIEEDDGNMIRMYQHTSGK
jgi:GNAT superfamily N-acetyltransferase